MVWIWASRSSSPPISPHPDHILGPCQITDTIDCYARPIGNKPNIADDPRAGPADSYFSCQPDPRYCIKMRCSCALRPGVKGGADFTLDRPRGHCLSSGDTERGACS